MPWPRLVLPHYRSIELGIFAVYPTRKFVLPKVRALVEFLSAAFSRFPMWIGYDSLPEPGQRHVDTRSQSSDRALTHRQALLAHVAVGASRQSG